MAGFDYDVLIIGSGALGELRLDARQSDVIPEYPY
jgi:hypothetical protein